MADLEKYRGELVLKVLADNKALPSGAGTENATNMAYIGEGTTAKAKIKLYAETAIVVTDTKTLSFKIVGYSSDTIASATDICAEADATATIYSCTASGGDSTIAGDTIFAEATVPMELLKLKGYEYVSVAAVSDAAISAGTYTALLVIEG